MHERSNDIHNNQTGGTIMSKKVEKWVKKILGEIKEMRGVMESKQDPLDSEDYLFLGSPQISPFQDAEMMWQCENCKEDTSPDTERSEEKQDPLRVTELVSFLTVVQRMQDPNVKSVEFVSMRSRRKFSEIVLSLREPDASYKWERFYIVVNYFK
jgi:hypothetical protein